MGVLCSAPRNKEQSMGAEKQEFLLNSLEHSQIMTFLEEGQKMALVNSMDPRKVSKGDIIIAQDATENTQLFVLEEGEVDVYIFGKLVRTLTAGENFGELGFAFGCIRSATCKMKQNGVLWILNHENFQKSVAQHMKQNGTFRISRQHSDNVLNPDKPDDYDSDMEILKKAGYSDAFVSTPRVLPSAFLRRLSDNNYEHTPSMIDRNLLAWEQAESPEEWEVDPNALIIE